MDAKITKKRLEHLLSYDWVKILITAVAFVMIWVLVFSLTATKVTSTERFVVHNYLGVRYGAKSKIYGDTAGYSYGILEAEVMDNMRGGNGAFKDLFTSNLQLSEGDVLMVADAPSKRTAKLDENGKEVKDENGKTVYEYGESYLHNLLRIYGKYITRLDDSEQGKGYFTQMQEYLAKFYRVVGEPTVFGGTTIKKATFDKDSLDESAVEAEFRARVKRNKDKRFKTEAQIVEGIALDKERIRSYLEAYETFFTYLGKGYVEINTVSVQIVEGLTREGAYGINLCPSGQSAMKDLKDRIYYTNVEGIPTAENLNAMFMTFDKLDKDFQYENLLYLNALIKDVCGE